MGGMFDRLKGLISVYAVAKSQKKDFRIHWTYPFSLEKYLVPNHYDWRVEEASIVYHYPQSRPLFLYGECYAPRRLMKNRHQESHFYYGYNSLKEINKKFSTHYDWGTLYLEFLSPRPTSRRLLTITKTGWVQAILPSIPVSSTFWVARPRPISIQNYPKRKSWKTSKYLSMITCLHGHAKVRLWHVGMRFSGRYVEIRGVELER